jgi:uncharacterized protein (DUF302 family)
MTAEVRSPYGFGLRLQVPYAEAVERTKAALKEQGFGVLTEIDVRATMKQKLDVDFRPYVILGACNPPLAHRALQTDPHIGLLLPCNVSIYDDGEATVVEAMDPVAALGLANVPALTDVAAEARGRLERMLAAVAGTGMGAVA